MSNCSDSWMCFNDRIIKEIKHFLKKMNEERKREGWYCFLYVEITRAQQGGGGPGSGASSYFLAMCDVWGYNKLLVQCLDKYTGCQRSGDYHWTPLNPQVNPLNKWIEKSFSFWNARWFYKSHYVLWAGWSPLPPTQCLYLPRDESLRDATTDGASGRFLSWRDW